MSVEILSVDKLVFQYNSVEVLSEVSFGMAQGDYLALVGPNGSGKTTLIKILLGFYKPVRGKVRLFGSDPVAFQDWHKIGYLPQKMVGLNPNFPATVKEIVGLGLLSRKGSTRSARLDAQATERALEVMDIVNIKDMLIGHLSGGQHQRALIARAIVSEPELLILDEPTTALDPEMREKFFGLLKRLNVERNITIIIITHDMGTIGKYASKLLYLDKEVVFCGSFEAFCMSTEMSTYFGEFSQHVICHRHDDRTACGS